MMHTAARGDEVVTWTADQLNRIGDSEELQLASRRSDGTRSRFTTMWVVRTGGELYVRSAGGPSRPWYRHAQASRRGWIRAGGTAARPRQDGLAHQTKSLPSARCSWAQTAPSSPAATSSSTAG
jgi:hypothetical protein